jgi:hypothetical protein
VVLAQRVERDVPGQHQLVVALVVGERGEVELARGEQLAVGGGHPAGGVGHMRVVGVLAQRHQQVADGQLGGDRVDGRPPGDHPQVGPCVEVEVLVSKN